MAGMYASLLSSYTPPAQQLNGGLFSLLPNSSSPMWIAVRQRFTQFHNSLALTPAQFLDGLTKRNGVVSCLNRHYYDLSSDTDNSFLIGSWGKNTATRPPRDVDVYFVLPVEVYHRLQSYAWNRQSALLQEVKDALSLTYPNTDMHGDGQVILVHFESYNVEVIPAFPLDNGQYWICDTHNGGSYKQTDPWSEVRHIDAIDKITNGNLRPLIHMLKAWQENCCIPLKSFMLELLAADFLQKSPWRLNDFFYFDWITRDFFAYLYHQVNTFVTVPGTQERIYLGNEWQSRTLMAYNRAEKACQYEKLNLVEAAGEEWQKIFGQQIPRML